jgi:hypothetical protein
VERCQVVQISTKSCNPHQTAITVTGSSHVIRGRSRSPGQSRVASNINMKMHIYICIYIYTYNIPRSISDYILSLADSYSLILSTYTLTIIYTSTHLDMLYIYTYNHIHKLYTNYKHKMQHNCCELPRFLSFTTEPPRPDHAGCDVLDCDRSTTRDGLAAAWKTSK